MNTRRWAATIAAFMVVTTALSACDHPSIPIGSLDSVGLSTDGRAIRLTGWAIDRDTASPILITAAVANGNRVSAAANTHRPDVGAAYPAAGATHGFDVAIAAPPGRHTACVGVHNVGNGADVMLGCRTITVPSIDPFGSVDAFDITPTSVRVAGWAVDPDAGGPIDVMVTSKVDGTIDDPQVAAAPAAHARPDVAAATRGPINSGYDLTMSFAEPGTHTTCVVAINRALGANRELGCRRHVVADRRPTGFVSSVRIVGSEVTVSGTATDPDGAPVRVEVAGRPAIVATDDRWQVTVSGLADGAHQFCATLRNVGTGSGIQRDRTLPCATAVIGALNVATTGVVGATHAVRSSSSSLADIDRDAGVSTRLSDGSTLWLFGDSTAPNPDGSMRYFVSGTAAWAPATASTSPADASDAQRVPYLLARPTESFGACPTSRAHKAMWPISAVTVPNGDGTDRVLVYLANMCLGSAEDFEYKGVSIGEYHYNPASPPQHLPVQLRILEQNLFGRRAYGTASVLAPDGYLYAYQCDHPSNPADYAGYGPCRVARVAPHRAHVRADYTYWDGAGWTATDLSAPAGHLPMDAGAFVGYNAPASSFNVSRDDSRGLYVMVYSPWPGFIGQATIRFAESPIGPWSAPVSVALPDCENTVGGQRRSCYAATPKLDHGAEGRLGLGFYDQATALSFGRGQYFVTSAAVSVSRRSG